jgi:cell division GTPase FtsZ
MHDLRQSADERAEGGLIKMNSSMEMQRLEAETILDILQDDLTAELVRAMSEHRPMNSAHEGLAVLLEEVDELKAEIWKKRKPPGLQRYAL